MKHGSCSRGWTACGLGVAAMLAVHLAPTAATGQDQSDPAGYIRKIYSDHPKNRGLIRYTPRLQRMLDEDKQGNDPIGKLDFDPITNAQDARISAIETKTVERGPSKARVRAAFKNFGKPNLLLFLLERDDRGWAIADISALKPARWTLSRILSP